MKKIIALVLVFLLFSSTPSWAFLLFGYDFDDNAFTDDAKLISGELDYYDFPVIGETVSGDDSIDLPIALNGPDLFATIEGKRYGRDDKSPYVVEAFFKDNYAYNGSGYDLTVWERGQAERVDMSIFDATTNTWLSPMELNPVFVGVVVGSVELSDGVNLAKIDFDLWGLPENAPVSAVRFIENDTTQIGNADITAIGALNSRDIPDSQNVIPEPATFLLFGSGLLGAFYRKSKRS